MGMHVVKVPDIGEGIAEVELVEWHVAVGDTVIADQILADVMTDKATVEVPSPVAGRVLAIVGKAGDKLAVGSVLIRLDDAGEGARAAAGPASIPQATVSDATEAAKRSGAPEALAVAKSGPTSAPRAGATVTDASTATSNAASTAAIAKAAPAASSAGGANSASALAGKPLASPSVRDHARKLGVDLAQVPGSGPGGRVVHDDVVRYAARGAAPPASAQRYAERSGERQVPVIGLRRQITQRMQAALRIPHFTYVEEIDVTELEALRAQLNAERAKTRGHLTVLPFLMRAIVLAVPSFPQLNARFDDDADVVTQYAGVHIGIATQTGGGLMVPVVRNAETRDLWSTAAEVARLAEAARTSKAKRDELYGSTITITSLGPRGGIVTTPIINAPEVAIIGVNRIVERPVIRGGAVVPRLLMNLSSSFDHRVVDGQLAADFVQALRGYLECPAMLFVD
jgi:2-oxoisovalerate dehydrogenase E2 component (dihydrolipoyl transacylase)